MTGALIYVRDKDSGTVYLGSDKLPTHQLLAFQARHGVHDEGACIMNLTLQLLRHSLDVGAFHLNCLRF